ncbi:DUF5801 repeats-in-toxin domain-containing protein [Oricola thermophila]|uniref:Cadherin-like domain-containing protein n=1 Tax=Oricola thermophila TaxID=2742145 RepID=A0A6N1V7Q9_9HYPH|nr:Ig-like domain-containing protein [Oricola thermophila]QKV16986.1 cadherin-like domain-containing protein [Oricola thermophila]
MAAEDIRPGMGAIEGIGTDNAGSNDIRDDEILIAQDTTTDRVAEDAPGEDIQPVDAGEGTGGGEQVARQFPAEILPDADNQVRLPAGVSLENVELRGADLVLIQPDGSEIVIPNAALNVPTFFVDSALIPQEALIAALEANDINVAAGPNGTLVATGGNVDSSGANFSSPVPGIGDADPILDLLPPTALQFPEYENEFLGPDVKPILAFGDGFVEEDDLLRESGHLSDGNNEDGSSGAHSHSGTLVSNWGTGGPAGVDALAFVRSELPTGLTSMGEPVTFTIVDNASRGETLTAMAGGRVVFTLDLIATETGGSYVFTLNDQLDHPETDDPSTPGTELAFEDILAMGFGIKATNGVGLNDQDTLNIGVQDDIPVFLGEGATYYVDEDDIQTLDDDETDFYGDGYHFHVEGSLGTSPQDGAHRDGSYTEDPDDFDHGPAYIFGSLADLFSVGSDEFPGREQKGEGYDDYPYEIQATSISAIVSGGGARYSMSEEGLDALRALGLTSKDDGSTPEKENLLDYKLVENPDGSFTLFGYVPDGADGGQDDFYANVAVIEEGVSGRLVFKLDLDSDGSFEFRLYDQLDHSNPGVGETGFPIQDLISLDFSSMLRVSDFDGDTISAPDGAFVIKVRDDVPELSGERLRFTADEDDIQTGLSTGNHPQDGNGDGSFTGSPSNNQPGPAHVSGSLAGAVESGADESLTFGLLPEQAIRQFMQALGLSSKGVDLSYDLIDNTLYAFANANGEIGQVYNEGQDRPVFTLEISENGDFDFNLFDQLDHDAPGDDSRGRDPLSDENYDLQDGVPFIDVSNLPLGYLVTATDHDGDTVLLGNSFTIRVRDDVPELADTKPIHLTVDEDDIDTNLSTGTSPNDGTADGSYTDSPDNNNEGAAHVFGSLASLVSSGADEGLSFGFANNARTYLNQLGLRSQGEHLSFRVVGDTLYGFVNAGGLSPFGPNDRIVFELRIEENGDFDFQLFDQLDHDDAQGENFDLHDHVDGDLTSINFGAIVTATDHDGDSVSLDGLVKVNVTDDVPVIVEGAEALEITVDEDDIDTSASLGTEIEDGDGDGSFTGPEGSEVGGPANATSTGTLASLVASGADEELTFGFVDTAEMRAYLEGLELTSHGDQIGYDLREDGRIIGFYNATAAVPGQTYDEVDGDRMVFEFELNDDGTYTFKLYDQIDHEAGNGENTLTIDFGAVLQATDHDGDSVSLDGLVKVNVTDDVPVIVEGAEALEITVDEDDIDTSASLGTEIEDGDGDGSFTGPEGSEVGGPANATSTGTLASLVASGADEELTFGFVDTAEMRAYLEGLELTSHGDQIGYDLREDGRIIGFYNATAAVPGQTYDEVDGDRMVFEFELNDDGTYTFKLYDQIDHEAGNGENTLTIDFGAVLQATDHDGDSVSLDGLVKVNVTDDVPVIVEGAEALEITVDEDDIDTSASLGTEIEDGDGDGSFTGPEGSEVGGPANATSTGTLASLVASGADEELTFGFVDTAEMRAYLEGLELTSHGDQIGYDLREDGRIIGFYNATAAVPGQTYDEVDGDRMVFEFELNDDGTYTFKLYDQIDHEAGNGENTLTIDFGAVLQATDHDGDSVSLDGLVKVNVTDDVPAIVEGATESRIIDEDDINGTFYGGPTGTSPNDGDEIDGSLTGTPSDPFGPAYITGSLSHLVSTGADEDPVFGFQEPVSAIRNGLSGLGLKSAGEELSFDIGDGIITAFVSASGSGDISYDSGTDRPVFRLTLDENGEYKFELFSQLDHPEGDGENSIEIDFGSMLQATDHDGDSVALDGLVTISVTDDIPVITGVTPIAYGPDLIVNGSFEDGHSTGPGQWEIYGGITGWNAGSPSVPFEVQGSNAGGTVAQDGDALIELDGDTSGNGSPQNGANPSSNTNATIQQTVAGTEAGQTYQLTFWYAPRGDASDSAGMEVFFGGEKVFDTDDGSYASGVWHQITVEVTAPMDDAVLAFTATGQQDELGALIDNVSMKAVLGGIDDESQAGGIEGGPGDDASGNILAGMIEFNAGADGFKSIAFDEAVIARDALGNEVALQAIWVDGNGDGQMRTVTTSWTPDGSGGGTLTGTADDIGTVFTATVDASGSYTIEMNAPLVHPFTDEDSQNDGTETAYEDNLSLEFGFTVTDGDGDTATGSLVVDVDDDTPVAVDDAFAQVGENASISGNVLADNGNGADRFGADGADVQAVSLVANSVASTDPNGPGELVFNADGNFTYEPVDGEEGTVTFDYTVTDADGDVATATATITLAADSEPTIDVGAASAVDEAALSDGSDPSSTAEETSGNFAITTGGDTIQTLVIDGQDVTNGGTVNGAYGDLVVTGTPGTGYSWVYTLNGNTTDHPNGSSTGTPEGVHDDFDVVVTDSDGDPVNDTLVINILDDGPTAADDAVPDSITGPTVLTGLLDNDVFGADGVDTANEVTVTNGTGGTVVYNGDGTFTFTPADGFSGAANFTYTIVDGDGDADEATVTLNVIDPNKEPEIKSAENTVVDEDGLAGAVVDGSPLRTDEFDSTESATDTGNIVVDFKAAAELPTGYASGGGIELLDSASLDGQLVALNGNDVTFDLVGGKLVGTATGVADPIVTIEMLPTGTLSGTEVTFQYKVTLHQPVKHPLNSEEDSDLLSGVEFKVTDAYNGDTATGSFDVTVWDDMPVANDDSAEIELPSKDFNIAFVLDFSGSISNGELATVLSAVKSAAQAFFNNTAGEVKMQFIAFSSTALSTAVFTDYASVEAQLDAWDEANGGDRPYSGQTDFTAAIEKTMDAFEPDSGSENRVFFLSDGNPNQQTGTGGHSLADDIRDDWNDFVTDNGIDVQTIGIGNGIDEDRLEDVDEADGDNTVILVTEFDDLVEELLTLAGAQPIDGNVLANDGIGADGGHVLSITIDGVTFTYDADADEIINDGGLATEAGSVLTADTPLGGSLEFNFATGDWEFTVNGSTTVGTENISYVLVDNDGDQSGANLTITVKEKPVPVAEDNVVSVDESGPGAGLAYSIGETNPAVLYKIDLGTGETTEVADLSADGDDNFNVEAMAISPGGGVIYAVANNVGSKGPDLLAINPVTGAVTILDGNMEGGSENVQGMHFHPDGTLYWVSNDDLYRINISGGVESPTGATQTSLDNNIGQDVLGFAINAAGDAFALAKNGNSINLYSVDLDNGTTSLIGATGLGASEVPEGLSFDENGNLWALERVSGEMHQIDTATGASTGVVFALPNSLQGQNGFEALTIGSGGTSATPNTVSGNVLADDNGSGVDDFGGDGAGGIVSITVDGHTYEFDGVNITIPGGAPGTDAGDGTLVVTTGLGGKLTFHFSDDGSASAGDYDYVAPNVDGYQSEIFTYVIEDSTGDTDSATLTINIENNETPVAVNDIVRTNIVDGSPIEIPTHALTWNDTDAEGDILGIAGVSNPVNGTASVGSVVFDPTDPVPVTILDADFRNSTDGFGYNDGEFGGLNDTSFADGYRSGKELVVEVGDIINYWSRNEYSDRDGGWSRVFNLATPAIVTISFDYDLFLSGGTDNGEFARVLFSIGGTEYTVAQLDGSNGNSGASTNGQYSIDVNLSAGNHEIVLGAYINEFDTNVNGGDEYAYATFDNVKVTTPGGIDGSVDYTVTDGVSTSAAATVEIHGVEGSLIEAETDLGEILVGGAGDDTLIGGDGDDVLVGGAGSDEMTGNDGADLFIVSGDALDVAIEDMILDYNKAEGDVVDLSALLPDIDEADLNQYVRYDADGSVTGTAGDLQVNADGAGSDWVTVANVSNTPSEVTILFNDDDDAAPAPII